jgi:alkanesulfonate monooxygenase SsuD/methylene tetrahydromethanopterin reductase-like flavin-dependent oxidoreductase (luciferase family)
MRVPHGVFGAGTAVLRHFLQRVDDSGLDQVCVGDHVSFRDGTGYDGLLQASVVAALTERVSVHTAVYVLPLRHPVTVARQVASLAELVPGRLVFGVGAGGDDPHEARVCGIDPRTRGRRMDEALDILRRLLAGTETTYGGEFFQVADACVRPVPSEAVPIPVGGRSAAAIRRAGLLGDGWYGLWVSAARYSALITEVERVAAAAGREVSSWGHHLLTWCGIGESRVAARSRLAGAMERLYGVPFERFERWCPAGEPSEIAEFLAPYVHAGCRSINLISVAGNNDAAVDGAAEVARLLRTSAAAAPVRTSVGHN